MIEIVLLSATGDIHGPRILVDWNNEKIYFMGPRTDKFINVWPTKIKIISPEKFARENNLTLINYEPSQEELDKMIESMKPKILLKKKESKRKKVKIEKETEREDKINEEIKLNWGNEDV